MQDEKEDQHPIRTPDTTRLLYSLIKNTYYMSDAKKFQMNLLKELQARHIDVHIHSGIMRLNQKEAVVITRPDLYNLDVEPYTIGTIQILMTEYKNVEMVPISFDPPHNSHTCEVPVESLVGYNLGIKIRRWQRSTRSKKGRRLKEYRPLAVCC